MNGILTTYGRGLVRYRREVDCRINPETFVVLEAQAAAQGLDRGEVYAVFETELGIYEATAVAEVPEVML